MGHNDHFRKIGQFTLAFSAILFHSFSDISSQLPVFSVELYQEVDHWFYPLCMAGIFIVFHAGKSRAQMCNR